MAKTFGLSIGFALAFLATGQGSSKDIVDSKCAADDTTCAIVHELADADASTSSRDDKLLLQLGRSRNTPNTKDVPQNMPSPTPPDELREDVPKNAPSAHKLVEPQLIPQLPKMPVIKEDDDHAKSAASILTIPGLPNRSESFVLVDTKACGDKVLRFNNINGQTAWNPPVEHDPYFPPDIYSIAGGPGQTCGDTAQGAPIPCETYDNWKTMQDVATQLGQTFKVIGPSHITFDDIDQGSLGNCYFLAALASIANTDPTIISDMFVEKNLWSSNIFKTKWYIGGQLTIISVDNMIPASETTTYFTKPSATGEFWPVILAKAWAKISGNFASIEGGAAFEVVTAIVRAPAVLINSASTSKTEDDLWTMVLDSKTNGYPQGWGLKADMYGLRGNHAYSILDAYTHSTYGRVLKMYNPWGTDYYNGAVPNTQAINGPHGGVFTMTLSEFHTAWLEISWNMVKANYEVFTLTVPTGSLVGADVTVPTGDNFYVAYTWPNRFLTEPCSQLSPRNFLKVSTSVTPVSFPYSQLQWIGNNFPVEVQGSGAGGTYHVLARADFPSTSYIPSTMSLTVYAPPYTTIVSKTATDVALDMYGFGNCPAMTLTGSDGVYGFYELAPNKLGYPGIPAYMSLDGTEVLYVAWPETHTWYRLNALSYWHSIEDGSNAWKNAGYGINELTCGCHDVSPKIPGFSVNLPCTSATDTNYIYSNVKCTGAAYSSYVQKYCPSSCGLCP